MPTRRSMLIVLLIGLLTACGRTTPTATPDSPLTGQWLSATVLWDFSADGSVSFQAQGEPLLTPTSWIPIDQQHSDLILTIMSESGATITHSTPMSFTLTDPQLTVDFFGVQEVWYRWVQEPAIPDPAQIRAHLISRVWRSGDNGAGGIQQLRFGPDGHYTWASYRGGLKPSEPEGRWELVGTTLRLIDALGQQSWALTVTEHYLTLNGADRIYDGVIHRYFYGSPD